MSKKTNPTNGKPKRRAKKRSARQHGPGCLCLDCIGMDAWIEEEAQRSIDKDD